MHNHKQGFSLVELSIVLVILGLLTGGILAGQSLIRASELRAVTTEYQRILTATQSFRDKYLALPGDMRNAQDFWGIADATQATCITTPSTTSATCNGNGNGLIEFVTLGSNELYRFWQHLANAGLLEGRYNGVTQGTTEYSSTAANSPASRLGRGYWGFWPWENMSGDIGIFNGNYRNNFLMGGLVVNTLPVTPLFRPEELWNIDVKTDDGKPALGGLRVQAWGGTLSLCTTTTANNPATLTADYLVTSSAATCTPVFKGPN